MHRLIVLRHCDEESWLPAWPCLSDLHAWRELEGERPLTSRGQRRARDLAERLLDWAPDRLLTSPLCRAAQTAEAIGNALGLAVEKRADLAEVSFGVLRGFEPRTSFGLRRLLTRIPAPRLFWSPFLRGMWLLGRTAGVFSPQALRRRSHVLRTALEREAQGRCLVVVAHGVILLYLHAVLVEDAFAPALKARHRLRTGEYRVLDFDGQRWNETARGRGGIG